MHKRQSRASTSKANATKPSLRKKAPKALKTVKTSLSTSTHHPRPLQFSPQPRQLLPNLPIKQRSTPTPQHLPNPQFTVQSRTISALPSQHLPFGLPTQINGKPHPSLHRDKTPAKSALTALSRFFSTTDPDSVDITYVEPSGEVVPLRVKKSEHKDDSLMTLAVKNQVDMEGSCDGQLACSTCHCILSQEVYDEFMKLKPPTDEELDMLDTAFGLTSTSRLGCQIPISMIDKNITLTLPKFTR